MNASTRYLRRDSIVLVLCVVSLVATLGAVGESGRGRAKEVVCQANLRQWGRHFQDYVAQNDGKFYSGSTYTGYWWPVQLPHELQDWTRNRTWFCPMATRPFVDDRGTISPTLAIHMAWGIYRMPVSITQGEKTYTMNPNGIAGSYGLNGYALAIPSTSRFEGYVPASDGWRDLRDVPNADSVPLFIDALRFDLWPLHTHSPAPHEFAMWSANHMARCCINRHDGAVNCLFVDGSVRKVGLKELWTLKWHRSFNTAGPWTKAGGVMPSDWPEWLRLFKEY